MSTLNDVLNTYKQMTTNFPIFIYNAPLYPEILEEEYQYLLALDRELFVKAHPLLRTATITFRPGDDIEKIEKLLSDNDIEFTCT